MAGWETLDTEALLQRREESVSGATTSGNVGAYQVPLGGIQRPVFPTGAIDDYEEDLPPEYYAIYGIEPPARRR